MRRVLFVALLICSWGAASVVGAPGQGKSHDPLFPEGNGADNANGKNDKGKQHYVLYAQVMGNVQVQLVGGGSWQVQKGDVFPVVMFKEQQTIAVLQLAGTNFRLTTDWLKLIEAKDITEAQVASYRASVERYLNKMADDAKAALGK